jgi:phage terminase Nu1 subunit (DNA packaging protein)
MAPSKKTARPMGKTQRQMATHLDMSQQRVAQFAADGTFPSLPDGKLDQDVCRVAYIRWLRDETRKSSASANTSRVQAARAAQIELQTAREVGKMVEIADVIEWQSEILGMLRSELTGVPAAATRDLPARAEIEKHLNGAIDRCRTAFEEAWRALKGGGPVSLGSEDPDT